MSTLVCTNSPISSEHPAIESLSSDEGTEENLSRLSHPEAKLPHTPHRYSATYRATETVDPISPVVLDIERRLFTPERPSSYIPCSESSATIMGYSCESYSPRPDDFYFDDGSGGHVVKLELPESEKELLSAEDFLSDIRKIESAIENVKTLSILDLNTHDVDDLARLDQHEHMIMQYLELLENYEVSGYRVLREACIETVNSPRRRDKANVPADKVTLYALGVSGEMAVNTLREECYRRLDSIHALLHLNQDLTNGEIVADMVTKQTPNNLPMNAQQAPQMMQSLIPRPSRRQTAPKKSESIASTSMVSVPDHSRAQRRQMSETMSNSVAKTAAEVLADSPTQFTFQPNEQMKVWSDGISGVCTFTFEGKEAKAYCRMWSKGSLLRVSVVVGGGFQSLDEWLERTFIRRSSTLKPNNEASATRATRNPATDTIHGKLVPHMTPTSPSMPHLSLSSAKWNTNSPSRSGNPGPRTPTSIPGKASDSSARRSSMLRNVSASSTFQITGDSSGSTETPKTPTLAQNYSSFSSPLLTKRARDSRATVLSSHLSDNTGPPMIADRPLSTQLEQISLTSPMAVHQPKPTDIDA